jgi:TNF receptor-associated protein 1
MLRTACVQLGKTISRRVTNSGRSISTIAGRKHSAVVRKPLQNTSSVFSYAFGQSSHRLMSTDKPESFNLDELTKKIEEMKNSGQSPDAALEEILKNEKANVAEEEAMEKEEKVEEVLIQETEKQSGEASKLEFQAETRKLLDIVARSLYTDKEVFVREIISNASDALEKVRHREMMKEPVAEPETQLEVKISVDEAKSTFIIQDSGIGMTKEELQKHLGRIGYSGTGEFLKLMEGGANNNMIGQFGVGFYSVFMVAHTVRVYTRSAADPNAKGYIWTSDGTGSYTIAEADGVARGTKIVLELREGNHEFSKKQSVENIVKKYSNFVGFPISLNGKRINNIKALWTMNKDRITPEEHKEFYQFISHSYDSPLYTVMYSTDSPINIRSLFYVPEQHMERYGVRLEPGVSLFCRKVLIQQKAKGLLPEWLRFVKGVVDSEDIPLNLSREHLQDSTLIKRLSASITRRLIKYFDDESSADPQKYEKFFREFGVFLKEGVCTDAKFKEDIAKLLRMESSTNKPSELTSLDKYIERMPKEQRDIYFLVTPTRQLAESSPYFEAFKENGVEVLFMYTDIDDFVMANLQTYKDKRVVTIESAEAGAAVHKIAEQIKKDKKDEEKKDDDKKDETTTALTPEEFKDFSKWMKEVLVTRVSSVTDTTRLSSSPAVIIDHESMAFRRTMRKMDPLNTPALPKQQLQVNIKHPIIVKLNQVRATDAQLAKEIAEQVFDNALIQAGLLDEGRSMIPRLQKLMEISLDTKAHY